jgi:hypothetical protein
MYLNMNRKYEEKDLREKWLEIPLDYLQRFFLNFSPYIIFLCHIITISFSTFFYLPQRLSLYSPLIPHYNYKISLANYIHHLLLFSFNY